jgi:hypothetical protein
VVFDLKDQHTPSSKALLTLSLVSSDRPLLHRMITLPAASLPSLQHQCSAVMPT